MRPVGYCPDSQITLPGFCNPIFWRPFERILTGQNPTAASGINTVSIASIFSIMAEMYHKSLYRFEHEYKDENPA
jgi:hypothetical protein